MCPVYFFESAWENWAFGCQTVPDRVRSRGRAVKRGNKQVFGEIMCTICTYCHKGEVAVSGGQISYLGHENRH